MARDYFTAEGLTTPQMMAKAIKYRREFDIQHVELVDIVDILEFKLVLRYPNFTLAIMRDSAMREDALAEPHKDMITVKESVYIAACGGNADARLTLAHELGHFLLHREKNVPMHKDQDGAVQPIKNMKATESIEEQADMFARHFLAPPHLAYQYRSDAEAFAVATGLPLRICKGNITMSKWPEVYAIRQKGAAAMG